MLAQLALSNHLNTNLESIVYQTKNIFSIMEVHVKFHRTIKEHASVAKVENKMSHSINIRTEMSR